MDPRLHRASLRRLRHSAAGLTPETVRPLLQPFADAWRTLAVPNLKDSPIPMDPDLQLSPPALTDLAARIRAVGMNLNKSGLKGLEYHNALQRHLAALAATFDCQGWTESPALFDDPDHSDDQNAPIQLAGRVDVVWSRRRLPVAVFEIDSTAKPRSLQKLMEAAASHKLWVYFGKDLWSFRTFLQREDPGKLILPIIVPRTFIPTFDD